MKRISGNIPGLALAGTVVMALVGSANAAMLDGYPDVIICQVTDFKELSYLHRVNEDGSAMYMTLGQQLATLTSDGTFQREGVPDCNGKSLEQLEKDGQTRDIYTPAG